MARPFVGSGALPALQAARRGPCPWRPLLGACLGDSVWRVLGTPETLGRYRRWCISPEETRWGHLNESLTEKHTSSSPLLILRGRSSNLISPSGFSIVFYTRLVNGLGRPPISCTASTTTPPTPTTTSGKLQPYQQGAVIHCFEFRCLDGCVTDVVGTPT